MTFGLGLGPVTWLLPAELFPMRKRAAATGLATAVNWLVNFAMGQAFLPCLATPLGSCAFLPFGLVLAAGLLFVHPQHAASAVSVVPQLSASTLASSG